MKNLFYQYTSILLFFILLILTADNSWAQIKNKYGLVVPVTVNAYKRTIEHTAVKQMLDVKKHIPGIKMELLYSTSNNFLHKPLYPKITTTYLRENAIRKLKAVQEQLEDKGLCLKIWDAYRPYSVTEMLWEPVKDERYAANPARGSGHNRGIAVDLTIVDCQSGKELDMGTAFDNFSDTAHHNFNQLPENILSNRLLLKTTMERNGFIALDTEWWHYSLPQAAQYELLNLTFRALRKLNR